MRSTLHRGGEKRANRCSEPTPFKRENNENPQRMEEVKMHGNWGFSKGSGLRKSSWGARDGIGCVARLCCKSGIGWESFEDAG